MDSKRAEDWLRCGPGDDTAKANARDHVAKNCEHTSQQGGDKQKVNHNPTGLSLSSEACPRTRRPGPRWAR